MKRGLYAIFIIFILIVPLSPQALAQEKIIVQLNDNEILFEQVPKLQDERVLVPLRALLEALGADVYWSADSELIVAAQGDRLLLLEIGVRDLAIYNCSGHDTFENFIQAVSNLNIYSDALYRLVQLDAPLQMINERTFVPIRAICEALDISVSWDGVTSTVHLNCSDTFLNQPNKEKQFADDCIDFFEKIIQEEAEKYGDRIEYPLEKIDLNHNGNYMLVMTRYNTGEISVITDTALLKENRDTMSVSNNGSIYATTPDGMFGLYLDGKCIDSVPFDNTLTYTINYGTLEEHFKPINSLTLQLLTGADIFQEDTYYTILRRKNKDFYQYYTYVHGTKRDSISGLFEVDISSQPPKIESGDSGIISFLNLDYNMSCYYDTRSGVLSPQFRNVKAVTDDVVLYSEQDSTGVTIIIRNMFDDNKLYFETKNALSDGSYIDELVSARFLDNKMVEFSYMDANGLKTEILQFR